MKLHIIGLRRPSNKTNPEFFKGPLGLSVSHFLTLGSYYPGIIINLNLLYIAKQPWEDHVSNFCLLHVS